MPTGLVTILGVVGIFLITGVIYISHTIEKQRAKRALLIANLTDKVQGLQMLIDSIPPAFVPKSLKLFILNEIKMRYIRLAEIAPQNTSFKKNLDTTSMQISDIENARKASPAPRFDTPADANKIKACLQELNKAIEAFVKAGKIQVEDGKQYLLKTHLAVVEADVNFLIHQAEQAQQEHKIKVAILHYQKAVAELSSHNSNNQYSERIEQLKSHIDELSKEELAEAAAAQASNADNELTKGIDDLIKDDNAWKKKYY